MEKDKICINAIFELIEIMAKTPIDEMSNAAISAKFMNDSLQIMRKVYDIGFTDGCKVVIK